MEVIAERDPADTRPVIIMVQDEGRFGRISDPRPCWAPKGVRPVARMAYYTGMRLGELLGLTKDRIDLERRLAFFRVEHVKERNWVKGSSLVLSHCEV